MDDTLIIDVGMHTGRDTEFYLKKGFNVVAVEAHPELAEQARQRFKAELESGRLTIHEVAIAEHEGQIDFYLNQEKDDWGTISTEFAARNEERGTTNTRLCVKSTRFQTILQEHGIPYYLKIDIEGADLLCLKALKDFEQKPKYVSIEASIDSFDEVFHEFALFWDLGYRKFKLANQAMNRTIRCPNPPLEGTYTDFQFDGHSSGPFGDEVKGKWMSIEEVLVRYRRILREQKYFGNAERLPMKLVRKMYEILRQDKVGFAWYDIHAKRED